MAGNSRPRGSATTNRITFGILTFSCPRFSSGETVNIPELPDSRTKVSTLRWFKANKDYGESDRVGGPAVGRLLRCRPPTTRHQVESEVKQTFPRMLISNMLHVFHCAASTSWVRLLRPMCCTCTCAVLAGDAVMGGQAWERKQSRAAGKVTAIIATSPTHLEPNPAPRARPINAFFGPVV